MSNFYGLGVSIDRRWALVFVDAPGVAHVSFYVGDRCLGTEWFRGPEREAEAVSCARACNVLDENITIYDADGTRRRPATRR